MISLLMLATACGHVPALGQAAAIVIDVRRATPISPYIYGINQPDWDKLPFQPPFVRQGGNRMTAYNWTTNASNAGNDYHNQNDGYLGTSDVPGWTVTTFMQPAQAHGAAVLLTVPMAGHVSADKKGDGDVANTPNYLNVRFKPSLAKKPGPFTLTPSPNAPAVYQDEFANWVEHTKSKTSPVWFSLDNEPDLWSSTHARIVPKTPSYEQFLDTSIEYAFNLKKTAPDALIFGWASYGWQGFRRFQNAPGANNRDFMDFYLSGMKAAGERANRRLLDVLDLHWYPEARGDGVRICEGEDKPGTPAARIQAPRSLWDSSYVEDSWIANAIGHNPINLLPDTLGRIEKFYPGTKLAITEYNYGGAKVVSGMIAQADVLGIFGKFGVFAAANWGLDASSTSQIAGFEAFLNYDGHGAHFGNLGLGVTGTTAPLNSVYASKSSVNSKQVVVVLINKSNESQQFRLTFKGLSPTKGTGYLRDAESMLAAKDLKVRIEGEDAVVTLPGLSVADISVSE
jgi:hypothetical protein